MTAVFIMSMLLGTGAAAIGGGLFATWYLHGSASPARPLERFPQEPEPSGGVAAPPTRARAMVIDSMDVRLLPPAYVGDAKAWLSRTVRVWVGAAQTDRAAIDFVLSVLVWGRDKPIEMYNVHDQRRALAPLVYQSWPYLRAVIVIGTASSLEAEVTLNDSSGAELTLRCGVEVEQLDDGELGLRPWLLLDRANPVR